MNKFTFLDKEFHFGIGFLNDLIDATNIRLEELESQNPVTFFPKMMFHSLAYAQKRKGQDVNITMETVYDLIDDNGGIGGKFWNDFLLAWTNSMQKDVPVEENKKKAEVIE